MTRAEVAQLYSISTKRIISPGRFYLEPIYAPHFFEQLCLGLALNDDGEQALFEIDEQERQEYPELGAHDHVRLTADDQGFVRCEAFTMPDNPNGDCHVKDILDRGRE